MMVSQPRQGPIPLGYRRIEKQIQLLLTS